MTAGGLPLVAQGLTLAVPGTGGPQVVLAIDGLALPAGGSVAITGGSGSGKTSLLHVLAGLVRPDAGVVRWGAADLATLGEGGRDRWRRRHLGLVFQDFHLVPELDILGNIVLPARFASWRVPDELMARARDLAAELGLPDLARRAGLLSRGEQQRVAIARALLHEPAVILADEPTASLDAAAGRAIADLLADSAARTGATLVVATHDPRLIASLSSTWHLVGGRVGGREAAA